MAIDTTAGVIWIAAQTAKAQKIPQLSLAQQHRGHAGVFRAP
jgi:hypothetical protein